MQETAERRSAPYMFKEREITMRRTAGLHSNPHNIHTASYWLVILLASLTVCGQACFGQATESAPLPDQQRQDLDRELRDLQKSLQGLTGREVADGAIFAKGLSWGLKYDREFTHADVALLNKAVARGRQRTAMLAAGNSPWNDRRGKLALGYRSRIDGSIQPYGLIVPGNYDPRQSMRLDVVLHGSTRPVGMSELRFMARFDEGDEANPSAPNLPYLELHPLGRVENCYRWAGETDVFEAIEDVCKRFNIDRSQIVLRGMSMGASGTWHLGLKHPHRFIALGPYCGYVDTHRFSETPLPNFVKVGPLPEHQELGLHMLDSVDYAANAGIIPAVACMGEKDVFFQAHVLMGDAMRREGLTMTNLISPDTGHVIDPTTHAEQMKLIAEHIQHRHHRVPSQLRFVTWTLKYSQSHWLQVLGLDQHYARAEISARLLGEVVEVDEPKNITRFAIRTDWGRNPFDQDVALPGESPTRLATIPVEVCIGDLKIPIPKERRTRQTTFVFSRRQAWTLDDDAAPASIHGKRPGLQGPIDDAFTTPFLCVRGTGQPWNPAVQAYADASLQRFADEWHHYFRGELPIKPDTAVTQRDLQTKNLILFGDPGSNSWIAKALPQLPVSWTRESVRIGTSEYSSTNHVPALIAPNPLNDATGHYLVLNSGHTFREAELSKLNYLLFPRWGDWAILEIDPLSQALPPLAETVVRAGYFDEHWKAR